LASVRAVVESLETVPPLIVNTPLPNAVALPTRTVPALTVAPPVKVFAPLNVKIPVPFFTSEPPAPLMMPLYVVVNEPPMVKMFPCKSTPPVPAKLAIVSLAPNFKLPGDVTVTAPVSTIAEPPFNVSVPPVTVVVPVYVFTPPNVNSPVPAFVQLPPPLTTPFQFTPLNTVTVGAAVIAPAPPNVSPPLLEASPSVTSAPIENALPSVRAVAESLETATPAVFKINVPVPSPVS
jgi:hypothetical protein